MKRILLASAVAGVGLCVSTTVLVAANISGTQSPYRAVGERLGGAHGQVGTQKPGTRAADVHRQRQAKRSRTPVACPVLRAAPSHLGDPRGQWEGYPGWRWDGDPHWQWDGYPRWLWHG